MFSFGAYAASVPGKFLYLNQRDGTSRLLESLGASWDLTHYLPSLVRADPRSLVLVGVGAGILLLGRRRAAFTDGGFGCRP